jgi:hypothetical protein
MVNIEDLTLDTIPIKNPSVIFRDGLDNGMVLVNCDTGVSIALNHTGAFIWSQIDGKTEFEKITSLVSKKFSAKWELVSEDVKILLSTLEKDGFIGYEIISGLQKV